MSRLWFLSQLLSCCERSYWVAVYKSWRTSKKSALWGPLWTRSELVLSFICAVKLGSVLVSTGSSCMVQIGYHLLKEGARGGGSSPLSLSQVNGSVNWKGSMHPSCGHLCGVFVSHQTHYVYLHWMKVSHRHSAHSFLFYPRFAKSNDWKERDVLN